MARSNDPLLDTGERLPELRLQTVKHGEKQLPEALSGGYSVLLIYRGHW
ncbi:MAG: hypothetical protein ACLFV2_00410 [Desulfurivibrionaceae bacterium]